MVEPLTWGVGFKCFALRPRHLWFLSLIFTIHSLCYPAATRTRQIIPFSPHVGGVLICGFLWG
jgi:hypothetical protein